MRQEPAIKIGIVEHVGDEMIPSRQRSEFRASTTRDQRFMHSDRLVMWGDVVPISVICADRNGAESAARRPESDWLEGGNGSDRSDPVRMTEGQIPGSTGAHADSGNVDPVRIDRVLPAQFVEQRNEEIRIAPDLALRQLRGYDDEGKISPSAIRRGIPYDSSFRRSLPRCEPPCR
jgi:hypothetical protein